MMPCLKQQMPVLSIVISLALVAGCSRKTESDLASGASPNLPEVPLQGRALLVNKERQKVLLAYRLELCDFHLGNLEGALRRGDGEAVERLRAVASTHLFATESFCTRHLRNCSEIASVLASAREVTLQNQPEALSASRLQLAGLTQQNP